MRKILLISTLILLRFWVTGQQPTNTDPSKNYINVNIPKTPESAAFEKYGDPEVSEFSGTSSVSIPLYTVQSRFIQVPVTLSYQATGVRVNQEASWVGLGFDLIAGGRITVETRGSVDFCQATVGLSSGQLQAGMSQIFTRAGNHGENAVYTPATFWEPPTLNPPINENLFNGNAIAEMALYGTGEPDIFRANFNGKSVSFYFDKISNSIKYIGEISNYVINYTLDGNNNITSWTILDEEGLSYQFNQTEVTANTQTSSPVIPSSTISARLLTKILHPTGDFVNFYYSNFGYSVPSFNMAGDIDVPTYGSISISNDQNQNLSLQPPQLPD